MPRENTEAVKRIFGEALDTPPDRRAAYLDTACQGDQELRARVEALLTAYDDAGEFLSAPTYDDADLLAGLSPDGQTTETLESERPGEAPGTTIGRYKLLQLIGEGGFGRVWMAEQQEDVRRRVALKIIKLGMDTKQVIARFEAERQALAMMDHPNIASVFDAGATETGRPYFVMELVKGIPITEYCDQNNLSTKERLHLFMPVCHAIQHAHQKGIIHRDIKPSNVMVTLHDGKPVPKVIDFGIAKATDHRLTDKTLFTGFRQLIGTPAYMSPEQAEMTGLNVDTCTDIYSLGVLLYELLTGTTPFDGKMLRRATYGELERILREVEPPKPSTRLSTLGADQLAGIARHRKSEPKALSRLVRGDLDLIVIKALEKDRTRRYATAKDFAEYVKRHLAHEPIPGPPHPFYYKLIKFVKRNRVAVTAGSLVAAALVLGLIVSTIGFVQASRLAERANAYSDTLDEVLGAIALAKGMAGTAQPDALAVVWEKAEERLADEPLRLASIHLRAAEVHWYAGKYDAGVPHAERAVELRRGELGEENPDTLEAMNTLAVLYKCQGRYDEAEPLYVKTLELRRRVLGNEDRDTLESMNNLAVLRRNQGRLDDAEELHREALQIRRRVLDDDHPYTLSSMANLAVLLWEKDELDEAERLAREALETRLRVLPRDHPDTLQSRYALALVLTSRGEQVEAERLYRQTLEAARQVFGDEHPRVAGTLCGLACLLLTRGDYDAAEGMFREALAIYRKRFGEDHTEIGETRSHLGECLTKLGRYEEAEEQLLVGYHTLAAALPESQWRINRAVKRLVSLYEAWQKREQVAAWRARLKPASGSADRSDPAP